MTADVSTLDRAARHFAAFVTAAATLANFTACGARIVVESDRAFCLIFSESGRAAYEPYRAEVSQRLHGWLKGDGNGNASHE